MRKDAISDIEDDRDHQRDQQKLNQNPDEIHVRILKCIDKGAGVEDQRDHH